MTKQFVNLKTLYTCQSCSLTTSLGKKSELLSVFHCLRQDQEINNVFMKTLVRKEKKKIFSDTQLKYP